MSDELHTLVDRIYESAVLPESWPDVLHTIAKLVDGIGTILFATDTRQISRFVASPDIRPHMEAWAAEGWAAKTQRPARMMAKNHAGWVSDLDVYTLEELETQPDYVGFFRPRGMGWGAGTFVPMPTGDIAVYSLECRYERGPLRADELARLDELRPHLARAALLSVRLQLERARSAVAALDLVGLPAALLRGDGRVTAANPLLEAWGDQVKFAAFGALTLSNATAQALLSASLSGNAADDTVRSIPLPAIGESGPAILHVIPIRRAAHDIFTSADAMIVITPVAPASTPQPGLLRGLFDLTPAEARLAAALTGGGTVEALSASLGVSAATLRTQLRSIFDKTGTSRQAELVGLLASVARPVGE